ncbi:MAG: DNA (cytosine-5-)-methyltransferase [Candidatus Electrothrix sp. Rat3]|nr:DNA (cytosine-5-)-methyltransferase [Candidatus Electrothrix rattekaaiensis]
MRTHNIRGLELFSGAGGLALGIAEHGVRHEALVEWNKDAVETLRYNFHPDIVHPVDIRNFDFNAYGHVDIIAGGPPCQPFSIGGKHKGNIDQRDMFPFACQAIAHCTPSAFIFENVKGLLRKSFISYFEYIILRLTYPEVDMKNSESWENHLRRLEKVHTSQKFNGVKYNVLYRLVDAADYGIPQRRERVVIVGIRDDLNIEWSFPQQTHSLQTLLWSQFVKKEYWERHECTPPELSCYDNRTALAIKKIQRQPQIFAPITKPWKTVRDQLGSLPHPDEKGTYHSEHIFRKGARIYPGHTGSFIDFPSKTIKAGGHGVPGGENMLRYTDGSVRYYTTYEAKLLQTFPEQYRITGSWSESMRQIGNAVPVELASIIAGSLIKKIWGKKRANKKSRPCINFQERARAENKISCAMHYPLSLHSG